MDRRKDKFSRFDEPVGNSSDILQTLGSTGPLSVFQAAGESHLGLSRRKNEDNFCLIRSRDDLKLLAVVADGIGGHNRGEQASYICCRELTSAFFRESANGLDSCEEAADFLKNELERINSEIYLRNRSNRTIRPMGTTVNAALFCPAGLVVANAGDSRCYRVFPDRKIEQLSTDHSFHAVQAAVFSEEQKIKMENVIYRAVGLHKNVEIELQKYHWSEDQDPSSGTRYLICTDGMYRYCPQEKIEKTVTEAASPRDALNNFMRTSLLAGGKDNITGIVVFTNRR